MALSGYLGIFSVALFISVSVLYTNGVFSNPFAYGAGSEIFRNLISRARRQSDPSIIGNGNGIIDESIPYWKEWLKENGYDPLFIASYELKLDPFLLHLRDCTIIGLTTLKRTGDITLNVSEAFVIAVANVGLDEISLNCNLEIRWSIVRARGDVFAKLAGYSVEGTVVQIQPPPRMSALRITNAGNLSLQFSGSGVIGTIVGWLAEGYFRNKLESLLTDTAKLIEIANEVLLTIDVENIVSVV